MQFKAKTKAGTLLDWWRAIHAVADECVIDTSETDVVAVRVTDPANALLIDMRIPDHAWDVLDMEPGRLGVSVELLIERTKMFEPDADVTITTAANRLVLSDGSARYTITMIEPDNLRKPPAMPALDLPAKIIIDTPRLQWVVKRAGSVSDHIRIGIVGEGMRVTAEGDTGDYEEPLLFDGEVVGLEKAEVSSLYSLDYMEDVAKNTAGDVVIELGSDLPMLISFVLHDAIIRYVQAPRIESD